MARRQRGQRGRRGQKRTRDVSTGSPLSDEAKEQSRSGMEGAPRGRGGQSGAGRQARQGSRRSGRGPKPRAKNRPAAGTSPSEQGEGSPSPERIAHEPGLQGQKQRHGARDARSGRGEDEATTHRG